MAPSTCRWFLMYANPISSHPIPSHLISSHPIPSHLIESNRNQSNPIQSTRIEANSPPNRPIHPEPNPTINNRTIVPEPACGAQSYKNAYYERKFGLRPEDAEGHRQLQQKYIEGIMWCFRCMLFIGIDNKNQTTKYVVLQVSIV